MRNTLLLFVAMLGIISCAPSSIIGHYSNANPSKISFAGKEFILQKDQTFVLNEWTDSYSRTTDEQGEVQCPDQKGKGKGTYTILNDSLELLFTNNDFISCTSQISNQKDSYLIEISLHDEMNLPLQAGMVSLLRSEENIVATKLSDKNGNVLFEINKDEDSKFIHIGIFGTRGLFINIEENIGKKNFKLKRCLGYYKKGDRIKLWYKTGRKHIIYQKKNGRKVKLKRIKNELAL